MVNNFTNIVENIVLWDGNLNTWQPPDNFTMLIQKSTPSLVWVFNETDWFLIEQIGQGQIGFIWDGKILTTNEPKPIVEISIPASNQPVTTGTQTL